MSSGINSAYLYVNAAYIIVVVLIVQKAVDTPV
ncbi:uncharacterized protein METZ01_LOCUS134487 [marine metagenome]|uniref:Uncharacterized protein n=1 Tax=marine metagenome TaxID=408172 RepID=A0A381YYH5_9ZZZZ